MWLPQRIYFMAILAHPLHSQPVSRVPRWKLCLWGNPTIYTCNFFVRKMIFFCSVEFKTYIEFSTESHLLSKKDWPNYNQWQYLRKINSRLINIMILFASGTLFRGYMGHEVMLQCVPSSTNTYQHVIIQHLQWIYRY